MIASAIREEASVSAILCTSFSERHLSSIIPSLRPLPPIVIRSGIPIKSASLNLTPGLSARSSIKTSAPAASAALPKVSAH